MRISDWSSDVCSSDLGIRSRLNENWSIRFQHRRDLIEDRALRTAISLGYQDECFLIEAVAPRTNYRDRELEEDDSLFVRVVFTYLGGVSVGSSGAAAVTPRPRPDSAHPPPDGPHIQHRNSVTSGKE